jgi:YesN/AraC family two-component response regulator
VNGKEGLHMCRQIKPILCIADVMMPVMNGIEFCQALKTDEFISHIPVILLTALSENEDKAKGYNAGADGYLVKPFDPSLLKTRIANIITSRIELKTKFSVEVESEISLLTHSLLDEDFMKKVTQLIDDHITENSLTTSFLCRELGMSTSKLYRKIKELTDLAPNEFIRTVRLKRSAILLKTKKYNVSEVTDLIGFNDPLYFSRCFKKQFGYPPSALIKNEASINAE